MDTDVTRNKRSAMPAPFPGSSLAGSAPSVIAALEAAVRRFGAASSRDDMDAQDDMDGGTVPLGVAAIDAVLPRQGLSRAALHEIATGDGSVSAIGFAAILAAKLAGTGGTVVWCRRTAELYGPGLAAFGLDPARLVVVRARRDIDLLWAMEEALRSGAPAAVVGETGADGITALRRLQLAAETHRVPALLVRPSGVRANLRTTVQAGCGSGSSTSTGSATGASGTATSAMTRWRVGAARSLSRAGPRSAWRLDLERCRGGPMLAAPKTWTVEWCDATGDLALAADVRHRPAAPAADAPPPG